MATFEFVGEIDDLSKSQLDLIRKVLETRGYANCKVIIEQVGNAGDNYVANIKRIIVTDASGKPFKMIAKVAPANENAKMESNTHNLFLNEAIMYTEILPTFKQMQLAAEVPKSELLRYAECYGCITDSPNEFILLEDLTEFNYTILNRFDYLSENSVKLLLKNIAILHSLSYALKNKHPEKFDDFRSKLFDMWGNISEEDVSTGFIPHLEAQAVKLMSDNDRRVEIIKNAGISKVGKMAKKISNADLGSRYTVVLQGDLWTNNIMFKFKDDILQDLVMIDYQLCKESSPVFDILYFLFNCTDPQMRLKHFHDWIDHYHTELNKSLSYYNLKANSVYPRDKLDADLKRYGKHLFSICTILASILSLKADAAAKIREDMRSSEGVKEMSSTEEDLDTQRLTKLRIEGMIDTLLEFGLA